MFRNTFILILIIGFIVYMVKKSNKKKKDVKPETPEPKEPTSEEKISKSREDLKAISRIEDQINDEYVKGLIQSIVASASKILENINDDNISTQANFLSYYIPIVLKICKSYLEITDMNVNHEKHAEAKKQMVKTLEDTKVAFQNQLVHVYDSDLTDIKTDMETLQTVMKGDGLIK